MLGRNVSYVRNSPQLVNNTVIYVHIAIRHRFPLGDMMK
jgi:hypothetical protein